MPRLLIVDDDKDLLFLLDAHFRVRGYEVDVAATCEEALRMAAENRPDVVLLDFCMPKMDGARFAQILRVDELTRMTPVVLMSAASASWIDARLEPDPLLRRIDKPFEFDVLDPLIEELAGAPRS